MSDARFEDAEKPLRLRAETPEDLAVMSALLQDAVGVAGEATWLRRGRRFAAVLSRFRWEDREAAARERRPFERVRCLLTVENVLSAKARGLDPSDAAAAFSILDLAFEPETDGTGVVRLRLSGGADVALGVEALEATLADVARPHAARVLPRHDD